MILKGVINKFFNKGNERSINTKKNILGGLLIKGFSIVVQLLLVSLTLDYLSDELYGVWITLSSIIIWMGFFDIGLTLGLKNRLAEALANKNITLAAQLVSTTYWAMIIIFTLIFIIGQFVISEIDWCRILNIQSKYGREVLISVRIIFGCVCCQMILNTLTAVLSAYQKVALGSIFIPIGNAIALLVIFILKYTTSPSLINLVIAVAGIPTFVLLIGSFYFYSHNLREVCPKFSNINKCLIKNLFNIGLGFFFLSLQYVIIFQSINFLISYFASPVQVTQYSIAHRYLSVAVMLFSIALSPLWPAFTDAYTKDDFNWMKRIYKKISKLYLITTIGEIVMIGLSSYIYDLWIGHKVEIPFAMTIWVGVYTIVYSWQSFQSNLLNGMGKVKVQIVTSIIGLALFIGSSIELGKAYGAFGIIWAVIVVTTLYAVIYTIQLRKILYNRCPPK